MGVLSQPSHSLRRIEFARRYPAFSVNMSGEGFEDVVGLLPRFFAFGLIWLILALRSDRHWYSARSHQQID